MVKTFAAGRKTMGFGFRLYPSYARAAVRKPIMPSPTNDWKTLRSGLQKLSVGWRLLFEDLSE
ncbi:hypothetical protein [Methylotuvimicrobium sp.]|uniref:hypothetical protein n=1 Tax=Methylotuvimicrobium sp. TaxID=2822413 RepID=UPI003D65C824